MSDEAQPVEGQDPTPTGIFDSYLQAVPEEHREAVTGYLKDAEKNVNSRLAEAGEIQKKLGQYKDVDLTGYTPEQLNELTAWHKQVTSNDEAFATWLDEQAQAAGYTKAEAEDLADEVSEGDMTPAQIQKLIEEKAQESVQPVQKQMEEWREEQAVSKEEQAINSAFSRLEGEEKVSFTDAQKEEIMDLGLNAEGDDWVKAGFDRYKRIGAESQAAFVSEKTAQPSTPVSAGGQAAFKPTTQWGEATEQARERLRQALST